MNIKNNLKSAILKHNSTISSLLKDNTKINLIIDTLHGALKNKNKIFICGNGGSASDANHIAAEFLVRLKPKNIRKPYPIIPLFFGTATITACSNDFGYKYIFSRNLESLANKNDVLLTLSTSGKSANIIEVLKKSKKLKCKTISLLGCGGGQAKKFSDISIIINSNDVANIQEALMFLMHLVLEIVEKKLMR